MSVFIWFVSNKVLLKVSDIFYDIYWNVLHNLKWWSNGNSQNGWTVMLFYVYQPVIKNLIMHNYKSI